MTQLALDIIAENKAKHARGEDASYLDLGNCDLTELPDLSGMDWVETLILSDWWWEIDVIKKQWIKFESQNSGRNQLEKILPTCLNLPLLKKLVARKISISDWRFLENLTGLTYLNLRNNQLSDGQFLKKLTRLTSLDLSFNQISDWQFLGNLRGLTYLNLSFNQISDWRFLKKLTKLTSLDLRNNQIFDAQFLENLTGLTSLGLSNNQVSDGRFLEKLTKLTLLDLRNNKISDLIPFLPLIKKGIPVTSDKYSPGINLYNNPLDNPPVEIIVQGNAAILRYFEEVQSTAPKDIRPLNEAKLIVIGQPRAGKTSLRYKLCDTEREMPKEDDSTRGIDIELQSFAYTDETGTAQTFRYHIWDFGGQQIYHATHRFFLTKRTVYVAVIDTDVNDKQNDLDYWLHMIELMGDGSPVFLVQNQKNDRSIEISDALRNRFRPILVAKDHELNLARLRKQSNPKFEAKRLADFQGFKKDIQRIFEQQKPILMTPAKSDTRQALERLSKERPVLELFDYRKVCIENKLTNPLAQMDLLRTLHNLGICLWYEGYDFLERIVILQNRWATDAVFKVLDNETVKKEKGHFRRSQLNLIWDAEEYKGRISELVTLMKQFKLCYQVGETDEYIVPQLLDKTPPEGFSRDRIQRGGVRMVIEYEFMPRGIMTQFIVAMHRQISGGQRHAWETGFAVQMKHGLSALGMAEESYDSRKLELWAKGAGAGLQLQEMLSELEKIHDTFKRLRYNKLIPCNCERCSAPEASRVKEFDYDEILLEMYQNRQPGIRCSYGNQTVPFDQLLGALGFTTQQTERDFQKNERRNDNLTNLPDMEEHSNKDEFRTPEPKKHIPDSNQNTLMKNLTWVLPVLISVFLIGIFFSWANPGSKLDFFGWFKVEQGAPPSVEPPAPTQYTIQVPIKINGEIPSSDMRATHAPALTAELTSGGLFTFRGLEIPKDKILIFELFYKDGKSAGLAQTPFMEANSNNLSVLNAVQFTGKLDKKRNQYVNITVAPQFKVQNMNVNGDGNKASQEQ